MKSGILTSGDIQQSSTGFFGFARGTTAQRPENPQSGYTRQNMDYGYLETYNGSGWIPLDSSAIFSPGFRQNMFYGSPVVDSQTVTSQYFASGTIYSMPFYIPAGGAFNRVGVNVGTAGYQSTMRLGIYSNLNAAPNKLLYNLGTVSTTSTGDKEIVFNNSANLYNSWVWISGILSAGVNLMAYGYTSTGANIMGRDASNTYSSSIGVQGSGSGTTLPSTYPTASSLSNLAPYFWIRKV